MVTWRHQGRPPARSTDFAPGRRRRAVLLIEALAAVLIAASAMAGCDSARSSSPSVPSEWDSRPRTIGAVCTSVGHLPDLTTAGEPTEATTPADQIDPPRTCHGNGNAVIQVDWPIHDHIHVAETTHSGDEYFGAFAICADGFTRALALANGVSAGRATALLEHPPFLGERLHTPQYLRVEARGPWTITIVDVAAMPTLNAGTTRGHGDAVLLVPPALSDGRASYTFTHNGTSNFIVMAGADGLRPAAAFIYVIGPYSGTKIIPNGTKVIAISADGDWTIKRNQ